MAGPNLGGVLVVHNTGVEYTTDPMTFPPAPSSCPGIVNQAPLTPIVWKVYAVFPAASSPRLASMAWGVQENLPGTSGIAIAASGLANTGDFEVTDGVLWPAGGGEGTAFTAGTRTGTIEEVYWFGGYGYEGAPGELPSFCTCVWTAQPAIWVDDAPVAQTDPIAGFGCMGFGTAGYTPCPAEPGACCDYAGGCTFVMPDACLAPAVFVGGLCEPNPCPLPGKCCDPITAACTFVHASECTGVFTAGEDCTVPCPLPTGACCRPYFGSCLITLEADCVGPLWTWTMFGLCDPDPCPVEPVGSCCVHDGSCTITVAGACTGVWTLGGLCVPNTCPQPNGSCCYLDGTCAVTLQAACTGTWTMDGVCDPNTCPPPPPDAACCHFGWINGVQNWCTVETQANCLSPNVWGLAPTCTPNPCPVIPTVESNWGAIKNIYR